MPQADYTNSASQSGIDFTADQNAINLAIQTLNSGTTAPTDLEAFMGWADTTTNFFKTRDSGNTTWYTQFPLNKTLASYVGELILVYGLGGTSPLKSGDDLNSVDQTGLYRITTGTANNTYGNGSVLVVNRGSGVVDQLILSITDSKLYLRNTANSGSLWTLKASIGDTPTLNGLLPSQTGNSGKYLTTNGSSTSWGSNVGAFATVNFDPTTPADVSGTYTRAGTLVTANITAHGHITGHLVYVDFTSGGALDGWYIVTRIDANTFTFNTVASGTITTSNLTLTRCTIVKAMNVQSVPYFNTGRFAVNFSTLASDANYIPIGSLSSGTSTINTAIYFGFNGVATPQTTAYVAVQSAVTTTGGVFAQTSSMFVTIFP